MRAFGQVLVAEEVEELAVAGDGALHHRRAPVRAAGARARDSGTEEGNFSNGAQKTLFAGSSTTCAVIVES